MRSKIIKTVRAFRWGQWLVVGVFVLAAGFTVYRTVRIASDFVYWHTHHDEPIHGWMNVGYVAHSYRVPPRVLYLALGLSATPPDKRPLRNIARGQRRSMDDIRATLQDAIVHVSPPYPPPPPLPMQGPGRVKVAMSFTDELLAAQLMYGLPLLFGVIVITAVGAPLPANLMLVAAGSFVAQGEWVLWEVFIVASGGAVVGDQIGYGVSRWGGRRVVTRVSRKVGCEKKVEKVEALAKRWGAAGIFFSRWLVTSLAPWINVTSGIAEYPWRRFVLWGVLGELLWVAVYLVLGYFFSDRVQAIAEILGKFIWVVLGIVVTVILGWTILQYLSSSDPEGEARPRTAR